jgi:hypothetical protein
MSEPTQPARTSRTSVVAIALGLLLIAAVIVVALWIERATDSDVELPDELSGGFNADPSSELADSAEDNLADVFDTSVTVRSYQADGGDSQVTITVLDEEAGPFAPAGPQAEPGLLGLERGPFELIRDGDTVCQLAWGTLVTKGDELPDEDPIGVQCQLEDEGRTYWLNGRGVTADDAVEILESLTD